MFLYSRYFDNKNIITWCKKKNYVIKKYWKQLIILDAKYS